MRARWLLFGPKNRNLTGSQGANDGIWQCCHLDQSAMRVHFVVRSPCCANRENDDLMDAARQRGACLVGSEHPDLRRPQGGTEQQRVEKSEQRPVWCDRPHSGPFRPRDFIADEAVVQRTLRLVELA